MVCDEALHHKTKFANCPLNEIYWAVYELYY